MATETFAADADPKRMEAVFHKRATALAQRRAPMSEAEAGRLVLTFSIGAERYAVLLSELSEVLPFTNHTLVPKADKIICGVINVRGELHSVLDLSMLLALEASLADEKGYVLVLKENGIGLKVHQLDQILISRQSDPTKIKSETFAISAHYSQAILQNNIILLNVEKILAHPIFSGMAVAEDHSGLNRI
jgi:purine-binding chemotaxis protein CheW